MKPKQFYQKIMSDKFLVYLILIAWILQYYLVSRVGAAYLFPFLILVLCVFYAGVRTNKVLGVMP